MNCNQPKFAIYILACFVKILSFHSEIYFISLNYTCLKKYVEKYYIAPVFSIEYIFKGHVISNIFEVYIQVEPKISFNVFTNVCQPISERSLA